MIPILEEPVVTLDVCKEAQVILNNAVSLMEVAYRLNSYDDSAGHVSRSPFSDEYVATCCRRSAGILTVALEEMFKFCHGASGVSGFSPSYPQAES